MTTLVGVATDKPWSSDLQKFYTNQNKWELDRVNKGRVKTGLEPRQLGEVTVGFSGLVSGDTIYIYHPSVAGLEFSVQLLVCVVVVTITWVLTTLITPAVDTQTLRNFYRLCHPGGPGWRKVVTEAKADGEDIDQKNAIGDWKLPIQILCVFLGCVAVYASLFAIGNFVYGNMVWGFVLIGVALVTVFFLFKSFGKIGAESSK